MYLANLVVDGVLTPLTRLFSPSSYVEDGLNKLVHEEVREAESPFNVEPVFWPSGVERANRSYWRANGAMALMNAGEDAMLISLKTNAKYPSFVERDYLPATKIVTPLPGSVVSDLRGRSFWGNIQDNISAPVIGSGSDVVLSKHVADGIFAQGVAARVLAFALEHALVPFNSRVRVRNASASYWCLAKYRNDNIVYSIQNANDASAWSSPSTVGRENDPSAVVWVGDAKALRGMALLSRIYDVAGPLHQERAYLLEQFDPGRLLMVGTGVLHAELPNVQANDFWLAIREALWILETYNNVSPDFMRSALHLLIHNLPILDTGYLRERDAVTWCTAERTFRGAALSEGQRAVLREQLETHLGFGVCESLIGVEDDELLVDNLFSSMARHQIAVPLAGLAGFAPPTNHRVIAGVAAFASALRQPAVGLLNGEAVAQARFDPGFLPVLPNVPPFRAEAFEGVWSAFSGRAAIRVFVYSAPPPEGEHAPAVTPGCVVVADLALLGLGVLAPVPGDGVWHEWVNAVDGAGNVPLFPMGLRAYAIRQWLPTGENSYNGWEPPPGRLRDFDLGAQQLVGVTIGGEIQPFNDRSPRLARYLTEVPIAGTPLEYLAAAGLHGLQGANNLQRALAVVVGYAYAWEAAHLAATQNDAYGRWIRANHGDLRLTEPADETMLYLGGCRAFKYIEPFGGLWALCYLKAPEQVTSTYHSSVLVDFLHNSCSLTAFILKLRCSIEVGDALLRVSNARLAGCRDGMCYNDSIMERLMRGRVDTPLTHAPTTYFSQQCVVLGSLFSNDHGTALGTFKVSPVGGMRLREPMVNNVLTHSCIQRMNWVTNQILPSRVWAYFLGIAQPSYFLDAEGRAALANARYRTGWADVDEKFRTGIFMDTQDETWSAVLTSAFGADHDLLSVSLPVFGTDLEVYVGDVRQRHAPDLAPFATRLVLPHETRARRWAVPGTDSARQTRPTLLHVPTDRAVGADIFSCAHHYDDTGHCIYQELDGRAQVRPWSMIDVISSDFAIDGLALRRFDPAFVDERYAITRRCVGEFWLSRFATTTSVAPAHSPALHALLALLQPSKPILLDQDRGGYPIGNITSAGGNADPLLATNPATHEFGDTPVHESGQLSQTSLAADIAGLDPVQRDLMMLAFVKARFGPDAESMFSNLTKSTDESTQSSDVKRSNVTPRDIAPNSTSLQPQL